MQKQRTLDYGIGTHLIISVLLFIIQNAEDILNGVGCNRTQADIPAFRQHVAQMLYSKRQ
jgi:hypothetical protein